MRCAIDHVDIRVSDLAASVRFYTAALAPLGWQPRPEELNPAGARHVGYDRGNGIEFSLHEPAPGAAGQDRVTTGAHIAFSADDQEQVQAFHAAATGHGGVDIGAPGPRPEYNEHYFGGFALDPDGNNVEAICNLP